MQKTQQHLMVKIVGFRTTKLKLGNVASEEHLYFMDNCSMNLSSDLLCERNLAPSTYEFLNLFLRLSADR